MLHTSNDIAALYVYDGTGSPIGLLTDYSSTALANTYDPYGTPTLTAGGTGSGINQNPYVFKGGVQSRETGWVHYGARWYNPATGRFTQQDTLDAPLNPANANRYAYAADDPVNLSDPLGTDADQDYVNGCLGGVIVGEGYAALGDVETLGVSAVAGAIIGCAAGFESAYLQENDEDQLDTDLTDLNYYTTICGLVC
ncbi:RHS repeat-associated core domain-containing protein [Subtercola boreus]|nr:RHS repeat-associated core domain-containing protein [Subtercola boreus]